MKFGIQHPSFTFDGPQIFESLKSLAIRAEDLGFDSFWLMDHLHQIPDVGSPDEPMLEGWITLATLAGVTSRIKLGTLVSGNVYRHPSMLAKTGATLDVLSKGRLMMGIGAAWNDEEAAAYGIQFPSTAERVERLEEAVQIIRKMWTEEPASFTGKFYQIRNAYCNPKPMQKPHPPILIGGSGERKTLKVVAKYGDACNIFGSPETVRRKLAALSEHCRSLGRDYNSILKTKLSLVMVDEDTKILESRMSEFLKDLPKDSWGEFVIYGDPDHVRRQVEAFVDAGVEYLIVNFEPKYETREMELFANRVIRRIDSPI